MSELEYRAAPNASAKAETLARLKGIVESTAEFIADFPERRVGTGTNGEWLDLGAPHTHFCCLRSHLTIHIY